MNKLKQILFATSIFLYQGAFIQAQDNIPSANAVSNQLHVTLLEQLRKADLMNQYIGFMLPSTALKNKDEIQNYLSSLQNNIFTFQDSIYEKIVKGENSLSEKDMTKLLEFNSCIVESLNIATKSKFTNLKQLESYNISSRTIEQQIEENSKKLESIENKIEYMGLSNFNIWYRELIEKDKLHAIYAGKVTAKLAFGIASSIFIVSVALNKMTNEYALSGAQKELVEKINNLRDQIFNHDFLSKWPSIAESILKGVGISVSGLAQPKIVGLFSISSAYLYKEREFIYKHISDKIFNAKIKMRGGSFSERNNLLKGDFEIPKETLDDVIGGDHIKQTCIRLIEQCANPKPFEDTKKKIRGVMFVGEPRTGKTFTAKAICGEINKRTGGNSKFKFLTVIPSDFSSYSFGEIISIAEDRSPCILCIEEIDLLCLQKPSKLLSDFLNWMSGATETKKSKEVIVIGITNNPEKLEPALLQPGRFEIVIPFERPGINSRDEYLNRQLKKYNISISQETAENVVIQTEGKTLVDIDNLISAVIEKSKELSTPIKDVFFEDAIDTEIRKIAIPQRDYGDDQEKSIAIYQAGKTLAMHLFSPERVIAKTTINPVKVEIKENKETKAYFDFGGSFSYALKDDLKLGKEEEILNECKILLAGAEAQKILTGSYHYNHQAKDRQKAMDNYNTILLKGQEYKLFPDELKTQTVTESTAALQELSEKVKATLEHYKPKLEALAKALLEKTSLTRNEIYQILENS